jgi:hypothetical protein
MKMNLKILLLLLLVVTVPFTIASGQEKKNEKKIKIVIDDGSGEKTVLDTTMTDGNIPGTITTKDGKVIVIGEPSSHSEQVKGEKMMHVTVTDDTDGKTEKTEKIIIMSGDGDTWTTTTAGDGKKHVKVYANAESDGDEPVKHVFVTTTGDKKGTWTSESDGKVYIITRAESIETDSDGENVKIRIESGDTETETEATKYIIAKDGIVVTIESDNEAKAKELVKEIENKLGINEEAKELQESTKAMVKKDTKK